MRYFTTVFTVLHKDLRIESRTREAIGTMLVFTMIVLAIFRFAFESALTEVKWDVMVNGVLETRTLGGSQMLLAGILWVVIAFAGMLGFGRSFASEKDDRSLDGMLLLPGDRSALLVGKILFNLVLLAIVEAILLPLIGLFFAPDHWLEAIPRLTPILFLGTIGYAVAGTLFAAVTANTRLRDLLLPILLLPAAVPVLVAATEATSLVLHAAGSASTLDRRESLGDAWMWIRLLVVCDVAYLVGALWLFEPVMEE